MKQYPQESNSQDIGRRAVKLFSKIIPANWIEKELDGDSDYGLDFMIQYKDNQTNFVKYKFNVQLKGTENGDKISEDEIKIQVKTSTLNYYKNMELVLFVICDLNKGECYYEYIHNILVELDLDKNQKMHTLKIPKKNILNSDFEIGAILEKWAESNHKTHEDIVAFEKEIQTNNICIDKIEIKEDDKLLGKITLKTVPIEVKGKILNVSIYPVTFEEYDLFCEDIGIDKPKDRRWGRNRNPVINIDWYSAIKYCDWLSEKSEKKYRLLHSDEWKKIADINMPKDILEKYNIYYDNDKTCLVDSGEAGILGILGIYHMYGNVDEWCKNQILMGGSFLNTSIKVSIETSAMPNHSHASIGFRIVREIN